MNSGQERREAAEMPNRYPGYCTDCGAQCPAGHGELKRMKSGAWVVSCGGARSATVRAPSQNRPARRSTSSSSARRETHRDGERLDQSAMLARAAEMAIKTGVEVLGTEARSYTARNADVALGHVRKSVKDGWMLVVALGHYDRYYHSEDACEDMDCFCRDYGWREEQEYWGIWCSEPGAERAARESREAATAAKEVAAKAEASAYEAAKTQIPADYGRRHGATLGGAWTITSAGGTDSGVEPAVEQIAADLVWTRIGNHHIPGSIPGTTGKTWTLQRAALPDGRPLYREDFRGYDDYRTTLWMPQDVYRAELAAEVKRLGITPEAAREWLAQYKGCVGTELYEFAAEPQAG